MVSIRPLRNEFRIRMSLAVLKHRLGTYDFPLNTINYLIQKHPDKKSKGFEYWLAAHAINSNNYFWQQADIDGIKKMTGHRLCIYLQKNSDERNRGPEAELTLQNYIFKKRGLGDWIFEVAKLAIYIVDQNWIGAALQIFENVLSSQKPDIIFFYKTLEQNLSSNEINQQFYAAFAKAGAYKAVNENDENVNQTRWKYYFKVKDKMVDFAVGFNGAALKSALKDLGILKFLYGNTYNIDGTNVSYSSATNISLTVIAGLYYHLAQPERDFYDMVNGFGEYYGHYLANRKYGTQADAILDHQRKPIFSSTSSSHKLYLESWNPNEQIDEKLDMKVGLFHDMEDLTSNPPEQIGQYLDQVQNAKASFSQKGIAGYAPRLFHSPERWYMLKENVNLSVPGQTNQLNSLFQAYNIQ